MILYSYWRSTTAYRVRAALNLKALYYVQRPVDLAAGEQCEASYLDKNSAGAVPVLELSDGTLLVQSLAILDYLEAVAAPRLLPLAPLERAQVLAVAHAVALDIHPVNIQRVVTYLKDKHAVTSDEIRSWMDHWINLGFATVEDMVDKNDKPFAFGSAPDLADICIVAQCYNAHRWDVDMTPYPKIRRIEAACLALPEIAAAHPDRQPDRPVSHARGVK